MTMRLLVLLSIILFGVGIIIGRKIVLPKYITSTVTTVKVIKGDTVYHSVSLVQPKVIKYVHDTAWKLEKVDTLAILSAYFDHYIYQDTLSDSTMRVVLRDVISKNKIEDRQVWFENLRKIAVITNTTTITPPSGRLRIGGTISTITFSPSILYTFQKNSIGISYDIINKAPGLTYYYQIW